jgi:threonyl-tRNA synthetase
MREQIEKEVQDCIEFAWEVLRVFGFDRYEVELSGGDVTHPEIYAGTIEDWKHAEAALTNTLDRMNVPYKYMPGEAAFYGPKIDVKLVDAIGRAWQLSTVQFDFNLPRRFKLEYVGEDGARHMPLMVHRALFGSIERFFGVLIEHYAGAFPAWLAPIQASVLPLSEKTMDYARKVTEQIKAAGFRVHLDDRNEKLQAKIRDAQLQKIPYMLVIGGKEAEAGTVAVRHRTKADLGPRPLDQFITDLRQEVDSHATQ